MNPDRASNVPEISVVIPIYNEQENLPELFRRLFKVLNKEMNVTYEIVLVDDGSADQSWEIIEGYHKEDEKVKGIKLSKNFGHHIAITAGLDNCIGQVIILMDGDLQAKPEDIPLAITEINKGFDIVWAVAKTRHDGVVARIGAAIFSKLFKKLGSLHIPEDIVFGAFSLRAVKALRAYRERRRLVAGILSDIGFSQKTIQVVKEGRYAGVVKYTFKRRLLLAITTVVGYSKTPLRLASYLGLTLSGISVLFAVWILLRAMFSTDYLIGWPSLIVAITMLSGIQLLVLGFYGEYIGVIIDEVKNRPIYIVEKKLTEREGALSEIYRS